MTFRPVWALVFLLAACGPPALKPDRVGPDAPQGTPVTRGASDGLLTGHRLMAAGEYELALKSYLRAAAQQGATSDVLASLGSANLKLGRLGQAERLLRRAIEADPGFVAAHNNLGVVLTEQGKLPEAREVFRTAFALDSGRSDDVLRNYRLALETTPSAVGEPTPAAAFALVHQANGQYLLVSARSSDP